MALYEFWLHGLQDLPTKIKNKLYHYFPNIEELYKAKEKRLKSLGFLEEAHMAIIRKGQREENFKKAYEELEKKLIRFIPWNAKDYPECLLEMPDYPHGLFVKGKLPDPKKFSVGIVGARKCTTYGEHYALEYGKRLSEAGIQIISGMAKGIDGTSHRGCLTGGTATFAVLGSGVDVCYPRENIGLYQDILRKDGGIISEYMPGTPPLAFHFPMRNRIISGFSNALIVIEAKEKSGSLITADLALEQGKEVYALPGSVNSSYSVGCHMLIKQGAGILISPEEFLKDLEDFNKNFIKLNKSGFKGSDGSNYKKVLDSFHNMVYSRMCLVPKNIDELIRETDLAVDVVMEILVSLELEGLIKEVAKNYYVRL